MQVKPLGDKIVVEVIEAEERTEGGIILPDTAKEEKSEGVVLSIGKEITEVQVGDKVLFGKFAGDDIVVEKKRMKVVRENEILGVLDETSSD